MKTRVCKDCRVEKPLSEFRPHRQCAGGHRPECISCNRARQNKSYHRRKADVRARAKQLYHANPEKHRRYQNDRYAADPAWGTLRQKLYVHGLTLDQYHALQERQDFSCAICKQVLTDSKEGTHIDHCHTSTRVRGLLCGGCNKGLGQFRDNPEALQSAATYVSARS